MTKLKKIRNAFSFVIGGLVAIIVGCFMLRGTMNLWDRKNKKNQTNDNNEES